MTFAQDSVVSALDELRQQERSRVLQESAKAREFANVARRQAGDAARRREEAKKNAEDLAKLRERMAEDVQQRLALETQLHALQAASRARPLAPSTIILPEVPEPPVRAHPLVWTATLLVSCLGVFLATYKPAAPTPAPVAALATAPVQCPEVQAAPAARVAIPATPQRVEPVATETRKRPRPAIKRPKDPPITPAIQIHTEDCDGPLCGMPE